jgi:hypothetical protein
MCKTDRFRLSRRPPINPINPVQTANMVKAKANMVKAKANMVKAKANMVEANMVKANMVNTREPCKFLPAR